MLLALVVMVDLVARSLLFFACCHEEVFLDFGLWHCGECAKRNKFFSRISRITSGRTDLVLFLARPLE
jgi:hypothetical protein